MAYTPYLNPPTVSLAGMTGSTWTTLSSGVPAGATGIKLLWIGSTSAGTSVRVVRKNGSTDAYTGDSIGGSLGSTPIATEWNIGVDASGNFQYFTASASPTEGTLYVIGYFGSESVFFTNAISLGSVPTSFGTISCSAAIPAGGLAGFFFMTGGDQAAFLRTNGSTDNLAQASELNVRRNYLVGCDGSQNINAIATTGRTLYCQGYMTAGIVWHTNLSNVTPATAGSNQNIAQAGGDSGSIGNLYYLVTGFDDCTFILSGQTSSTFPTASFASSWYAGPYSAYAPSQINLQSTTNGTLYELGYFTATSATPSIAWFT